MKQVLIKEAQQTLADLRQKRHGLLKKLMNKRRELLQTVQEDTPDLFGERKSERKPSLFNIRADQSRIEEILQPFVADIAAIDKEIDKWETDLLRLANMSETNLFSTIQNNVA